MQIEGVDYNETFAPVAKLASLCMILALAAEHDLKLQQMDMKSTYLNRELRKKIFMEAPPGFDAIVVVEKLYLATALLPTLGPIGTRIRGGKNTVFHSYNCRPRLEQGIVFTATVN